MKDTINPNLKFSDNFIANNDSFSNMNKNEQKELMYKIANSKCILREKLNLDEEIKFGIEIEYSNAPEYKINKYIKKNFNDWNTKEETSVQNKYTNLILGGEVVSPILKDDINTWKDLKLIYKYIKKQGGKCTNCGAHIHFDNSIINYRDSKTLQRLIKFWIINESIIYRFSMGNFLNMRPNFYMYADIISNYIDIDSRNFSNENIIEQINYMIMEINRDSKNNRIYAYLTGNPKGYNTIEIRCPNETLNASIRQNYINFFAHFLKYIKDNNLDISIDEIKETLLYYKETSYFDNGMETELDKTILLSDKIYNNNLDKIYFLKQYLKKRDIEKINEEYKDKSKRYFLISKKRKII